MLDKVNNHGGYVADHPFSTPVQPVLCDLHSYKLQCFTSSVTVFPSQMSDLFHNRNQDRKAINYKLVAVYFSYLKHANTRFNCSANKHQYMNEQNSTR